MLACARIPVPPKLVARFSPLSRFFCSSTKSRMFTLLRAISKLRIQKGGSLKREHSYSLNREIFVSLDRGRRTYEQTHTHTDCIIESSIFRKTVA